MSRFLGYVKKLNRRISKLERSGTGNVADAMRDYYTSGLWPTNPGLKLELKKHLDFAYAIFLSVSAPPKVEEGPCSCGVCEQCGSVTPNHERQPSQLQAGDSGRGVQG